MKLPNYKKAFNATTLFVFIVWMISSFVFAFFHREQLTLLCAGFAQTTCLKATVALKPRLDKRLNDFGGTTALIYLLDRSSNYSDDRVEESLHILLSAGADPNFPDDEGWTPLMVSTAAGRVHATKMLLANGAQINKRAKGKGTLDGMTPLMVASHHGHLDLVDILLKNGAKADLRTPKGLNAALVAAMEGHEKVLEVLEKNGVAIDRNAIRQLLANGEEDPEELGRAPASALAHPLRTRLPEE